jgi:transposase
MSKVNRNDPKRSKSSDSKTALMEFEEMFPNDAACLEYLVKALYPNGIHCPKCQKVTKHYRDTGRPSYTCEFCGHHVHPMAGTIFQDSATSLKLWFYAIYLMSSTRCGISAKQLERELGVTYKTAWRMFNRIRSLMSNAETAAPPLGGNGEAVEMDETYIGPRRGESVPVFGITQRKRGNQPGRVRVVAIPNGAKITSVMPHVKAKVLPATMVYTDESPLYNPVTKIGAGHQHRRIYHSLRVYVQGDIHTSTVDGFWALVKNGIGGVYHGVSTKHLQAYLDEYAFRYNSRKHPAGVFNVLLSQVRKEQAAASE